MLGLSLAHGGHLTHGMKINFSGRLYDVASYEVDPDSYRIDMDQVRQKALDHRPEVIVLGIVGLIAQLIDGSLGMAYGVTSTTLLLAAGTAPAAASAAISSPVLTTRTRGRPSTGSSFTPHAAATPRWAGVSMVPALSTA